MRGILGWGAYVPHHRLDRTTIAGVVGQGGGKGTRAVASYDEDATTLAAEAALSAVRASGAPSPRTLWFSTVAPPYLDKTNATAIHAVLRLPADVPAFDGVGSVRSAVGALHACLAASGPALAAAADLRGGLAGSADESAGGDGGVALLIGDDGDGPVLAELVGSASVTEEFLDRWREPGAYRSKVWEERFGEQRYVALGRRAWASAGAPAADRVIVAGPHDRAMAAVAGHLGLSVDDPLRATIGNTGAAAPGLQLVAALERAEPGEVIAQLVLADGADVLLWRVTRSITAYRPVRPLAEQLVSGAPLAYPTYLAWRGVLGVEPPRRPEPQRPSASAAARSAEWKFGFVGSQKSDGSVQLPPALLDDEERPMADVRGTIRTFTIDRLAYSPSPPIVFAVVDFDGGGRLPVELTDVRPDEVRIGDRVEMTFRRLFSADGIHNYFWKARPVRSAATVE